jgi:hypothetical protein
LSQTYSLMEGSEGQICFSSSVLMLKEEERETDRQTHRPNKSSQAKTLVCYCWQWVEPDGGAVHVTVENTLRLCRSSSVDIRVQGSL